MRSHQRASPQVHTTAIQRPLGRLPQGTDILVLKEIPGGVKGHGRKVSQTATCGRPNMAYDAQSVMFDLPDVVTRAAILAQYARQLSDADRQAIAAATPGMSGRDLRDVCEISERRWASKVREACVFSGKCTGGIAGRTFVRRVESPAHLHAALRACAVLCRLCAGRQRKTQLPHERCTSRRQRSAWQRCARVR